MRRAYCEDLSLEPIIWEQQGNNSKRLAHLALRKRSEQDFFVSICKLVQDRSNPVNLSKGKINEPRYVDEIESLHPEIVVAYGCSLIRAPLLAAFDRRILNVHLGLSPYYRGSSTNYWPLVNGSPEYVGATFMYMDSGIDTGEVIHQIRARIYNGDSPHQIGNRLICDVALVYGEIIRKFEKLECPDQVPEPADYHYYRRGDFSEQSVKLLHENLMSGMVDKYIEQQRKRCAAVPIVENSSVRSVDALMEAVT